MRQGSDSLYRLLVESLSDYALFAISLNGEILTWDAGAVNVFGYTQSEALGKSVEMLFTREDVERGLLRDELAEARVKRRTFFDRQHVRKDGALLRTTASVAPIYAAGTLIGFTKLIADRTTSYREFEDIVEREERFRSLVDTTPGYLIFSLSERGEITTWNSAAQLALGYTEDEILGVHFAELFPPEDVANGVPSFVLNKAGQLGIVVEDRWFVRKDGTRFLASETVTRLTSAGGGFVHVAHDITERNARIEDIRRKASVDELTALPNRSVFFEHVTRAISAIKRRSANPFAVLFIDLDHFKQVNDTLGHIVADRLLAITARRLERCVRTEDIVARIGGDEFAILLTGIADGADADDAAERIAAEMRLPALIDGHTVRATVSIGIAIGHPRYNRPEEVLQDADEAMYLAKAGGPGRSRIFSRKSATCAADLQLRGDVRWAAERNELRLLFQPVMRLQTSTIVGFEALVRWQHPRCGLLSPGDFVALAEETDVILAIDRWVLREACRTLSRWHERFVSPWLTMSVNFSGKHFSDPGVVDVLAEVLAETDIPAACLQLEITERTVIEQSERSFDAIAAIRALGVELHIDDFGVGYSSLSALGDTPVQALKIDRSFVAKMDTRNGAELIRAITQLAGNLGLTAIAEGIETPQQLRALLSTGCEYGQGFLLAQPVDAEGAVKLLESRS